MLGASGQEGQGEMSVGTRGGGESCCRAETLDREGAVFIKFYWDVKFADCLLSKRERAEIGQQSHCEERLLIAVCFVTAMGVMIKCGLF